VYQSIKQTDKNSTDCISHVTYQFLPLSRLKNTAVSIEVSVGQGCRRGCQRMAGCRLWGWRHAATSPCRLWGWRHAGQGPPCQPAQPHAGDLGGGRSLPALAQAARATCRLPRRAATESWSFLAKKFTGGPFRHFVGAGGLICQKFTKLKIGCMQMPWPISHSTAGPSTSKHQQQPASSYRPTPSQQRSTTHTAASKQARTHAHNTVASKQLRSSNRAEGKLPCL
jgi:hypothetical protein